VTATPRTDDAGPLDDPSAPPPSLGATLLRLIQAVRDADPQEIEEASRRLGRSRRLFAPLGLVAGTLALMVDGLKPLVTNWRLTLVEVLPAVWIWLCMWNLRYHLGGKAFVVDHLPLEIVLGVAIVVVTTAGLWCNTVFALALGNGEPHLLRPAFEQSRRATRRLLRSGVLLGVVVALAALWAPTRGKWWFAVSMSIAIALLMVCFIAVPARILGISTRQPMRQKVSGAALGGTLSAVAATPGFILDRVGLLIMGIPGFRVIGIAMLSVGVALQAAATSSVRAVKLSYRLVSGPDGVSFSDEVPDVELEPDQRSTDPEAVS
jgi:hypothetical protein